MPNATNPRLFVDDTCLIVRNCNLKGLEHECNREIQKLRKWCCASELQINIEKSKALMIPSQLAAPKTDLMII